LTNLLTNLLVSRYSCILQSEAIIKMARNTALIMLLKGVDLFI